MQYLISGAYAEWIGVHPEVLGSVLPPMLGGLKETHLAQSATLSLKEVLKANQEHITPYVSQILTASKDALDNTALKVSQSYRRTCLLR